jgi:Uma2 family endonuclease
MSRVLSSTSPLTLEAFLRLPGIEESPAAEFVEGRVVRKMSPSWTHNSLTLFLCNRLNEFAMPEGLGEALPEQRCTFGGRSIVPDVVYLAEGNIALDRDGRSLETVPRAPDLMIEILSPGQAAEGSAAKLAFAVGHGCSVGWLVDPYRETITVFTPESEPIEEGRMGLLDAGAVLPGFTLAVDEVFAWVERRRGKS